MNVLQLAAGMGCSAGRAQKWLPHLEAACARFEINTPQRQAMWLAQVAHECDSLGRIEESFKYSAERLLKIFPKDVKDLVDAQQLVDRGPEAIANRVYARQPGSGNGDEASGHGWLYRGRGCGMCTGLNNYRDTGAGLGLPLLQQPDLLLEPAHAAASFAWFWWSRNLNHLADQDEFQMTSNVINRGNAKLKAIGSEDRFAFWTQFQTAFGLC